MGDEDILAKTVEPGGGGGASTIPLFASVGLLLAALSEERPGEDLLINLDLTTILDPSFKERSPRLLTNDGVFEAE